MNPLTQHLVLESMLASFRRVIVECPTLIAFCWGILQMKFHKSWLRKAAGILVILASAVIEGYWESLGSIRVHMLFIDYGLKWPNKNLSGAVMLIISLIFCIGIVLLFEEGLIKGCIKENFSLLSGTVFARAAELIVGGIKLIPGFKWVDSVSSWIMLAIELIIILSIAYFIKKKADLVLSIRNAPTVYYIICLIIYLLCMQLPGYVSSNFYVPGVDRFKLLMFGYYMAQALYVLIAVLLFVFLWLRHYKHENYLKNKYLLMLGDYYSGMASHVNEVRGIKHDIKAHMNVLKGYLDDNNVEQARKYLSEMDEHQSYNNARIMHVGHELVDAVLTEAMQRSENKEIILDCEGALPKELPVADFDLCTIFSNIITNSTEACNRLKEKEKRITLRIQVIQRNVVITCENPIEWEIDTSKLKGHTSKKNKESHGYGLQNIERTIAKYGGEMKLTAEDGIFRIGILLFHIIDSE